MLKITWPQTTRGEVFISGSKNAALPLIACGLFFSHFTLHNVPRIGDVFTFLEILKSLGIVYTFEKNTLIMDNTGISLSKLNRDLIKKIRVGIVLFPSLLKRFWELNIPYPGGCYIGKRPITEHLRAFEAFGYTGTGDSDNIAFFGQDSGKEVVISAGFSVTATENILMMAAFRPQKTTIQLAAIEPHVMNLIDFLRSIGVNMEISYDHTIVIMGISDIPDQSEATVIADYIESGTFIILGALTSNPSITVRNARIRDLFAFLEKCEAAGIHMDIDRDNDSITVYNSRDTLRGIDLQTNIFPGFPTDLQSPFALLLSQAEGNSRIHEVLFEWRLNWLVELEKMKWHIAILNPHEALIFGGTPLKWATVSSWDLRAGVTMILAGLIAEGITKITNVAYIERGYEDIVGKISSIWWNIEQL